MAIDEDTGTKPKTRELFYDLCIAVAQLSGAYLRTQNLLSAVKVC